MSMIPTDSDEGVDARRALLIARVAGAVALLAAGVFVLTRLTNSPEERDAVSSSISTDASAPQPTDGASTTSIKVAQAGPVPPTTSPAVVSRTSIASATSSTPSTTVSPTPSGPSYSTLPDGTPEPIVAVFDVETITVSGSVPSQAAKDRLTDLAIANSKFPNAVVHNLLTIDPSVPTSIGVRVIELTSARFPSGSAEILPPHAAELDRVATVMTALPNVTVLVIGHADQMGSEVTNYALSEERAQQVVSYIVTKGVAASRLSSRAVGEADLLSVGNDATSLALNRRTEFVFYGLIVGV
jgi:outer membrane protein OmpA-like peptidoglycan-associated protein